MSVPKKLSICIWKKDLFVEYPGRVPRHEIRPAAKYLGLNSAPPTVVLNNTVPNLTRVPGNTPAHGSSKSTLCPITKLQLSQLKKAFIKH